MSRVDPILILDLLDGALADPSQHTTLSHTGPAIPAAGVCWRCETSRAADDRTGETTDADNP